MAGPERNSKVIRVTGTKELRKTIRKIQDTEAKKALKVANREASTTVANEARANTVPVRSGRLKASIKGLGGQREGYVKAGGARAPYAGPIHYGWPARNIKPQPFVFEALDEVYDEIRQQYADAIREICKSLEDRR